MPSVEKVIVRRKRRALSTSNKVRATVQQKKSPKVMFNALSLLRRMDSTRETMEVLQDKKAMKAIRDFEAGKMTFKPLSAIDDL